MSLRCHFDSDGWLQGPISISHRMTPNRFNSGFAQHAKGLVFHTEDGHEAGTVATFMDPSSQASAFFSIGQSGAVTQYLPVGRGFVAWAEAGGNPDHYSIEDEDGTHPSVPLTAAQVRAFAQILEACSARDGFPLAITDDPVNGRGLILHSDGGQAWGGHTSCPGPVRAAQRPQIVALAMSIRAGSSPQPARQWTSQGQLTLHDLCAQHLREPVHQVLAVTLQHSPGSHDAAAVAGHIDAVFGGDSGLCPAGITWRYPGGSWLTKGQLSLASLAAAELHAPVHQVIALTGAPGFPADAAAYIDAVFARTPVKVAAGTVFFY